MPLTDPTKFRFCSDRKWKEKVSKLQGDFFVRITVDTASRSVIVTGEKDIVEKVIQELQSFLSVQTSVEEQVYIGSHQWVVMTRGLHQELDKIKGDMQDKEIKIEWPTSADSIGLRRNISISLQCNPTLVDKIKRELEALAKKVHHREENLGSIPAALQVVDSMEDKIHALEGRYGASINILVTSSEDMVLGRNHSLSGNDLAASKLCSAACPNGVRISVYKGNFTQHSRVDAIVVFSPPRSENSDNLKLLFASGGSDLQNDFKRKKMQFKDQGDIFVSNCGKLQCNELWHCIIPLWSGNTKDKDAILQDCLGKVLCKAKAVNTILFTSACSHPLKYPTEVFARNIVSSVSSHPVISNDLVVAVYVSEAYHARNFEVEFEQNSCQISKKFSPIAKALSTSIRSFITLTQGDMLQQQVYNFF